MDDVLVSGTTQEEHDARLHTALQKIQAAGITLNKEKCQFSKNRLTFLGHVIDKEGISADPQKTCAIVAMEKPKSRTELRRFMGMANQLGKFTPRIAEISQPLRELLSTKKAWIWDPCHEQAFEKLKTELTQPTILALYDPDAELTISADASAYGLGAVLLQKHSVTQWKPIAYASRSMNETEQRYSQIEKEALALVWSSEKFSDYVLGKHVRLETDHKPLVPSSPRHISIACRLDSYDYDYVYQDSITVSSMLQGSFSTLRMHCLVLRLRLLPNEKKSKTQRCLREVLWHTYQLARTASTSTEKPRRVIPPAPSCCNFASMADKASTRSRETSRATGSSKQR